jgi:hypothetical protein
MIDAILRVVARPRSPSARSTADPMDRPRLTSVAILVLAALGSWLALRPPMTVEEPVPLIDDRGDPTTFPHMAAGWAVAFDARFSWTERVASDFGGTLNGAVVAAGGIGPTQPLFFSADETADVRARQPDTGGRTARDRSGTDPPHRQHREDRRGGTLTRGAAPFSRPRGAPAPSDRTTPRR